MENKHKETGKFISGVGVITPELVTVENDYSISVFIAIDDLTVEMHNKVAEEMNRQIKAYEMEYKERWKGKPIITRMAFEVYTDSDLPLHCGIGVEIEASENKGQNIFFILYLDKLSRNDLDYLLTLALDALKAEILKRSNI